MITHSPNLKIPKTFETPSLDQLLPMAEGRVFYLARMAMLRASEIHFGSPPLVAFHSLDKETSIALREIAQGKSSLTRKSVVEEYQNSIIKKEGNNGQ